MILSSVGELLKHFGSYIAIFLLHMCNMIASVHVHIERDVCVPQPFLLTSMVGYRTERGGCSAAQTTLVRAETFSQADTHTRGRKAQWGREAPALFCLAAGKPPCLPPPRKGGCRGPQHGGSCTTFEMSLSTVLPPPEWFPSAGSLPSAPVPDWRETTSVGCCCIAPAFLYISVWQESSGRSLGSGDKKVDSSKSKRQKKPLQSRRVSRFKQIQQKQMIM